MFRLLSRFLSNDIAIDLGTANMNYANVSLSSSDPAVATVNNFGKVTEIGRAHV